MTTVKQLSLRLVAVWWRRECVLKSVVPWAAGDSRVGQARNRLRTGLCWRFYDGENNQEDTRPFYYLQGKVPMILRVCSDSLSFRFSFVRSLSFPFLIIPFCSHNSLLFFKVDFSGWILLHSLANRIRIWFDTSLYLSILADSITVYALLTLVYAGSWLD